MTTHRPTTPRTSAAIWPGPIVGSCTTDSQHNVGLLNNFISAIQIAKGTYFRWIGDDDWLAPDFVSRTLECFAEDERRLIVTTRIAYTEPGRRHAAQTTAMTAPRMASPDPVERLSRDDAAAQRELPARSTRCMRWSAESRWLPYRVATCFARMRCSPPSWHWPDHGVTCL